MSEVINLKEAAKAYGRGDRVLSETGIKRAQVGRGATYHIDVGSTARAIASDYVARPAAFGPRGWPQVGGILSAQAAAEALVLHSEQTHLIRASLLTYHEDLSELGLTDPRADPPEMDGVLERLVHQIQHYHPEALDTMRKRTRASIMNLIDLSEADSRLLVSNWLKGHGETWLDLVFDEYGHQDGELLPESNDELRALFLEFWPASEAAAALPRWSLTETEVSAVVDAWLQTFPDGELINYIDVNP